MKAVLFLAARRHECEARGERGDAQSERRRPKTRGGDPPSEPRDGKAERHARGGRAERDVRGPRGGRGGKGRHARKFLRLRLRAGKSRRRSGPLLPIS